MRLFLRPSGCPLSGCPGPPVRSGDRLGDGGPAKRFTVGGELRFEHRDRAGAHQVQVAEVVVEVEADSVDLLINGPMSELGTHVLGTSDDRVSEQVVVYRARSVQAFL